MENVNVWVIDYEGPYPPRTRYSRAYINPRDDLLELEKREHPIKKAIDHIVEEDVSILTLAGSPKKVDKGWNYFIHSFLPVDIENEVLNRYGSFSRIIESDMMMPSMGACFKEVYRIKVKIPDKGKRKTRVQLLKQRRSSDIHCFHSVGGMPVIN